MSRDAAPVIGAIYLFCSFRFDSRAARTRQPRPSAVTGARSPSRIGTHSRVTQYYCRSSLRIVVLRRSVHIATVRRSLPTAPDGSGHDRCGSDPFSSPLSARRRLTAVGASDVPSCCRGRPARPWGDAASQCVARIRSEKRDWKTGRGDSVRAPSVTWRRASRQRGPKRRVRGDVHASEGGIGRVSGSMLRENGQPRYFCEPAAASSGLVGTPCGMNASGSVPTPSPSWTFEPACSAMPAPSS